MTSRWPRTSFALVMLAISAAPAQPVNTKAMSLRAEPSPLPVKGFAQALVPNSR